MCENIVHHITHQHNIVGCLFPGIRFGIGRSCFAENERGRFVLPLVQRHLRSGGIDLEERLLFRIARDDAFHLKTFDLVKKLSDVRLVGTEGEGIPEVPLHPLLLKNDIECGRLKVNLVDGK